MTNAMYEVDESLGCRPGKEINIEVIKNKIGKREISGNSIYGIMFEGPGVASKQILAGDGKKEISDLDPHFSIVAIWFVFGFGTGNRFAYRSLRSRNSFPQISATGESKARDSFYFFTLKGKIIKPA